MYLNTLRKLSIPWRKSSFTTFSAKDNFGLFQMEKFLLADTMENDQSISVQFKTLKVEVMLYIFFETFIYNNRDL